MSTTNTDYLKRDAGNRAVRSLFIGLGIDVLVGVALVLGTYFSRASEWGQIEWAALGLLLVKSVLQSVGSFVTRRFLDPSRIPSPPLPPAHPGEPDDDSTPNQGGPATRATTPPLDILGKAAMSDPRKTTHPTDHQA